MKNISLFFSALIALLFSVAETSAQITPPYYNPANVRITGGTINGTSIGATTRAAGSFTSVTSTGDIATSTSLYGNGGNNTLALRTSGVTTGYTAIQLTNTGGNAIFGQENSTGGNNLIVGASGYDTIIRGPSGLAFSGNNGAGMQARLTSSSFAISVPVPISDTTDSSSTTTGSLKTAGGLGVAKKAYFGDAINVNSGATNVISTFTNNNAKPLYVLNDTGGTGFSSATSFSNSFVYLTPNSAQIYASSNVAINGNILHDKTITTPGTTGAVTINKTTGRVNFAAAATSLVVTNSLATANSICHVTKATNDATMRLGACVTAAGSFTIYADVAPAAETAVNFTITN